MTDIDFYNSFLNFRAQCFAEEKQNLLGFWGQVFFARIGFWFSYFESWFLYIGLAFSSIQLTYAINNGQWIDGMLCFSTILIAFRRFRRHDVICVRIFLMTFANNWIIETIESSWFYIFDWPSQLTKFNSPWSMNRLDVLSLSTIIAKI